MATDVAARGLDIPHIRNVINFDVARDIDTHTHRVGRTGRAGVKGTAYTLVTEKEKEFAGHIVRNLEAANQVNKFAEDGHILRCAAACRESFRVYTFRTCFMTSQPADVPAAKAMLGTHGIFSKKSLPTSRCATQYIFHQSRSQ